VHLFISYSTADQAAATAVCTQLEAEGLACWMAPRDVAVGAQWDQSLLDAIDQSSGLVLILSQTANDSPFVQSEVNRAFRQRKPIFTLRIENVAPSGSLDFYLARHHWMDAFNGPSPEIVAALGKAISGSSEPASRPGASAATRMRFSRRSIAIVATIVAVLGLAGFAASRWPTRQAAEDSAPAMAVRLAVLPLRVVGSDRALAPVAFGLSEALSAKLAQVEGATVSSIAAVQQLQDNATLADVGRTLGVGTIIDGTIQGNAGAMRITLVAHDASSGQATWTREFTGVMADLLTLEDTAFNEVITALQLRPTAAQAARAVMHATANIEAYRLYLQGRNAMRGQSDLQQVETALTFFKQAVSADPAFALAYAGLADANIRLYRDRKRPEYAQGALAAAQQAQQLDDTAIEVKLALASVYQATGKSAEALATLTSAVQLAPRSDDVLRRLGRIYLTTGRGKEALASYQRAIDVNPYYWVSYSNMAFAQMQLGDYDKAVDALRRVITIDPRNTTGHNDLGAAYLQLGKYADAAAAFQRALEVRPMANTYTNLGLAYAYAKSYREAVSQFEKAVALAPNDEQLVGNLGDGYRWAGDKDQARTAYQRATELAVAALKINPRDAQVRANLAMYFAKQGDYTTGRRMIREALAISSDSVTVRYAEATIEALAGRKIDALLALRQAVDGGFPRNAAGADPDLQGLAGEPGFADILRPPLLPAS
jgi:tetratricopeptide (TPR) repeat protein